MKTGTQCAAACSELDAAAERSFARRVKSAASYRLDLEDAKPPFLQGWAIIENTTDEDWKAVNLTLISGRPISFIMDLYQPLYVQRPTVVPEIYAALRRKFTKAAWKPRNWRAKTKQDACAKQRYQW